MHYYDPHWPITAEPGFETDAGLEAVLSEREVPETTTRPLIAKTEDTRFITNAYDDEILYMDGEIGKLLARLETLPDWEETVLLVIGDHGEGLGQHGHAAHGGTWDEQLWAPMMIRVPDQAPRRVPGVVSVVDALPTLLGLIDVAGLDALLPQVSGRDLLAGGEPVPVFSQNTGRLLDEPGYRYSLTTDRWKYFSIREAEGEVREELYDLESDPHELDNLAAREAEGVLPGLRGALVAHMQEQESRARLLRRDAADPEPLDPELIEQLESLGYVGE